VRERREARDELEAVDGAVAVREDALDARGGEDPGDLADAARAVDREDGGAASEGALEIEGGRAGADAEGEGARDLLAAAEREDGEGAFGLVRGEELEATFHATSWGCAANARGAVRVRGSGVIRCSGREEQSRVQAKKTAPCVAPWRVSMS
jgi:hypothetical protein